MLLDRYESLLFNPSFKEAADNPAVTAYRGDLVLQAGEVGDALGHRRPPVSLVKQAIVLAEGEQLLLLAGLLDQLQDMPLFLEKFGADITPQTQVYLFVVNIPKAFVESINGARVVFTPLAEGLVWTELSDMAALEKGDFKGQGSAEKVVTLFDALKDYTPKMLEMTLAEALQTTNDAKRTTFGAI